MSDEDVQHQRDLLGTPWKAALFWGLPWVFVVIGGGLGVTARTVLWAVGFFGAGVACLANARRCRRRHCYYTGPLFLSAALASLLYGFGMLPHGRGGWAWIAGATLVGSILLCCGLDAMFGKYMGKATPTKNDGTPSN